MVGFDLKDLDAKYEAHKKWWAGFWAKSFVEIPDKHEKWNHILSHLSKYATRDVEGKTIFRYTERGTEYWGGNTLGIQHIYPALGIGLESDPKLIEILRNTIHHMQRWFDNNGDNSFFPAAAYVAYDPEVIYAKLGEYVATQYRPNGMRENKHGAEKLSTIPNTVNMMLCSVHQDVMRLYPAWPGKKVQVLRDGAMVEMLEGEKLTLETKIGEMIELIPAK